MDRLLASLLDWCNVRDWAGRSIDGALRCPLEFAWSRGFVTHYEPTQVAPSEVTVDIDLGKERGRKTK